MSFEKIAPPSTDPVEKRREAMAEILASWDLEGAIPDATGLQVVREYVAGRLELPMALEMVRERAAQLRAKENHSAQ
ncbi:antitoxin VbhA family protein [Paenarthrobacter nitroguajacolicus]|uniref:antitoxin VbhA family protein n=1 Tax=Paenarthrobacter nitroguajacolicus TaxID=211146 RepID=UPI003D1DC7AE